MNELIMVVVLAVYFAVMYFVTGFFIVGEDICLLPTREKSPLEKFIVRRKIGGVRK